MAQQVKVILVDDLAGGDADETIRFAVDGTSYEIDLNVQNAASFRAALAPYVKAGRRAGRSASARSGRRTGSGERRSRAADIRAWARSTGIDVSERGRIPAKVVEQYDAAH